MWSIKIHEHFTFLAHLVYQPTKQPFAIMLCPSSLVLALVWLHWRIYIQNFWCKPLPTGPNSFIFTYVFTKKWPCWRSTPHQNGSTPPMGNPGSAHVLALVLFMHTSPAKGLDIETSHLVHMYVSTCAHQIFSDSDLYF